MARRPARRRRKTTTEPRFISFVRTQGKSIILGIAVIFLAGLTLFALGKEPEQAGTLPSQKPTLNFYDVVGKQAADFALEDLSGNLVKLRDLRDKIVVLFFTEGVMCYPACWDQMAAFANDPRFNNDQVTTFAILVDPKKDWERVVKETPRLAKANTLFDTKKEVSYAYNVMNLPSSMHPRELPGHTYFVVDKNGIIRFAFDDPDMAIRNDLLVREIEKLK